MQLRAPPAACAVILLFMGCCLASPATPDCSLLASFLASHRLPSMNAASDCCQWEFVKCTQQRITRLHLSTSKLTGSIANSTLGGLQNLSYLDLSDNNLTGDVPEEVWNSSRLQHLDLSGNNFSGAISSALWRLPNLTYVNLSSNSFQGRIDSIGKSSGAFPLQTVDLSANDLGGSVSKNFCTGFANLRVLKISSNRIDSGIFSQCISLQFLNASFNKMNGSIVLANLFQVTSLTALDLKHNLLAGTIPSLERLSNLTFLDLSFNNLNGNFNEHQQGYRDLSKLSKLDLSNNSLTVAVDFNAIRKFGMSAFLNNSGFRCTDCASPAPAPTMAPAPSHLLPFPSARKASLRVGAAALAGIAVAGSLGIISIAVASAILCKRALRRKKWAVSKPRLPFPHDKHVPEIGPFSFEADAGTWVADVKNPTAVSVVIFEKPLLSLTFADLLQATSSFDRSAEMSDGCSGLEYKCVLPGVLDGDAEASAASCVAIQVLEEGRSLSEGEAVRAFEAMGRMKHENLVPLLGYCVVPGGEKLLIYEHMEGGSLEGVLQEVCGGVMEAEDWSLEAWERDGDGDGDGAGEDELCCKTSSSNNNNNNSSRSNEELMRWETRARVALGIARGLAYLHHGCSQPLPHGALHGSNILLHGTPSAARLAHYGGALGLRHSPQPGYIAPECTPPGGTATPKGDVYSLGVVLMQLATRKPALGHFAPGCTTLVAWVRQLVKQKRAHVAIHATLRRSSGSTHASHALDMLNIAYLCTADSAAKRPSIQQVVGLLKDLATPALCNAS